MFQNAFLKNITVYKVNWCTYSLHCHCTHNDSPALNIFGLIKGFGSNRNIKSQPKVKLISRSAMTQFFTLFLNNIWILKSAWQRILKILHQNSKIFSKTPLVLSKLILTAKITKKERISNVDGETNWISALKWRFSNKYNLTTFWIENLVLCLGLYTSRILM